MLYRSIFFFGELQLFSGLRIAKISCFPITTTHVIDDVYAVGPMPVLSESKQPIPDYSPERKFDGFAIAPFTVIVRIRCVGSPDYHFKLFWLFGNVKC